MSYSNGPTIVTDGLVLALDAGDRNSYPGSGTTWSDLAGSNNGTLTNGPTFDSNNGGAIVFDGADDYVLTTSSDIKYEPQNFTVNVWFSLAGITAANGYYGLIANLNNSFANGVGIYGNNNVLRFTINQAGDPDVNFAYYTGIQYNTIYNVQATYDNSNLKLYINGVLVDTVARSETVNYTQALWDIGVGSLAGGIYSFDGSVYHTSLYNRPLNAAEVLQNYNATKGRFGL